MKKPSLSEMTLREKIGQMLLPYQYHIYHDMDTPDKRERTMEEVAGYIEKEKFGSFYMEQVDVHGIDQPDLTAPDAPIMLADDHKKFMEKQDALGKIPAFMTIDAETEGAGKIFHDLSVTCKPLAIGAADSEELAFELGVCIGKELRCAGANWRWAPCVDISNRFALGYNRTYAPDDPDKIIKIANAHIRGVQSVGVAATAKHFPGADRYEYRDPHFCPNIISSDMDEWWREQGKIFREIINAGVYSVMVGHSGFPACDNSTLKGKYRPATVSRKIVTDLLKGELGFKGVVVTDGIVMAGLTGCYDSYEELIIDLVNAGNDVLLGTYPGAGDIIEKAVAEGKISEARIDDACSRILDMKEKTGLFDDDYKKLPYNSSDVAPQTKKVNTEIARRAITKVYDRQNLLPLDKNKIKNVTIICSTHYNGFFEKLSFIKKCIEDRGMTVRLQRRIGSDAEMDEIAKNSDLIIYAAYVAPHQPKGHISLYGEECVTYLYAFSKGNEKSIGLSMGHPTMHYEIMANAETFINAYGMSPELMEAFVEAIFGEIPIVGKSPVNLTPNRLIFT